MGTERRGYQRTMSTESERYKMEPDRRGYQRTFSTDSGRGYQRTLSTDSDRYKTDPDRMGREGPTCAKCRHESETDSVFTYDEPECEDNGLVSGGSQDQQSK